MDLYYHEISSPLGAITLIASDRGLSGVYLDSRRPDGAVRDANRLRGAAIQVDEYFAGARRAFDIALDLAGTPFQLAVWNELRAIPYGATASYRDIAFRLRRPTATRAVGAANGRNPVSIIVPCHRVIGASGELTGYAGGLDKKRFLLAFESGARGIWS